MTFARNLFLRAGVERVMRSLTRPILAILLLMSGSCESTRGSDTGSERARTGAARTSEPEEPAEDLPPVDPACRMTYHGEPGYGAQFLAELQAADAIVRVAVQKLDLIEPSEQPQGHARRFRLTGTVRESFKGPHMAGTVLEIDVPYAEYVARTHHFSGIYSNIAKPRDSAIMLLRQEVGAHVMTASTGTIFDEMLYAKLGSTMDEPVRVLAAAVGGSPADMFLALSRVLATGALVEGGDREGRLMRMLLGEWRQRVEHLRRTDPAFTALLAEHQAQFVALARDCKQLGWVGWFGLISPEDARRELVGALLACHEANERERDAWQKRRQSGGRASQTAGKPYDPWPGIERARTETLHAMEALMHPERVELRNITSSPLDGCERPAAVRQQARRFAE